MPEKIDSRQPNFLIVSAAFILAGFLFWNAARLLASVLQPFTPMLPSAAGIGLKAAVEESLRISITIISALCIRRFGWNKKTLLLCIVASVAFAILENANYLLAFPSSDIYARAGYSSLIHANNAAIMVLALLGSPERKNKMLLAGLLSFLFCWVWHFIFNLVAASGFIGTFALPGIIANCVILLAVFFWSELIHFHKEEIDGRN